MEVFVVEIDNGYDFYDVIGVYSDREKASEAIDAYPGEEIGRAHV